MHNHSRERANNMTGHFTTCAMQVAFDECNLSEAARDSIASAFVSRGPRKGLLKKNAPKVDRDGWEAIMLNLSPVRCSFSWAFFDKNREVHSEVDAWAKVFTSLFECMHPYEFSLHALHYDTEKTLEAWETLAVQYDKRRLPFQLFSEFVQDIGSSRFYKSDLLGGTE